MYIGVGAIMEKNQQSVSSQIACNKLLRVSCEIYSDINSLYGKLESNIASTPKLITEITERLSYLQEQASEVDSNLKCSLKEVDKLTEENDSLLKKRTILLRNLVLRNKALTQKAGAVKSHFLHEVNSINTNRTAISGYRPPENKSMGLINRSF
ncbi:MAG: peptidoglycan hydrolase CwlO-like protein [Desulforhopalus sp.]|jgi:peptidoglycan hydrolase CwlO-like protein